MLTRLLCSTLLVTLAAACRPAAEDYPAALAAGERLIEARAFEAALAAFDTLHRRFPEQRQPLDRLIWVADRLGRPEVAIAALERQVASGGPQAWVDHQRLASLLAKAQRPEDAKRHYREVLRLRPENAAAYFELSRLEGKTGDYDAAVATAAEGVRQAPDDPRLRTWYGETLLKRGRGAEAEEVLRKTLELDGAGAYPHYVLGLVYLDAGELEPARRQLETATALQPNAHEAWYQLANVCERLGDTEARDQALQEFTRLYRLRLGGAG